MTDPHPITSALYFIARLVPVAIDRLTLGQHPDATQREAGELALLDWTLPGGPIVAECEGVLDALLDRVSPIRALGAALIASDKHDDAVCDELPLLSGLAGGAVQLAEHQPGGPADLPLRVGLCARALAMRGLGDAGDDLPELNARGMEVAERHQVDYDRAEARWPIERSNFWHLDTIAHIELTPADRALLEAVC